MPQSHGVVVVDGGFEAVAKYCAGDGAASLFSYFRIGQGGWEEVNGQRVNKNASEFSSNTNIDIIEDAGSYPADVKENPFGTLTGPGYFQKNLGDADVTWVNEGGVNKVKVRCVVADGEANEKNAAADSPEFFEIGVFDSDNNLILYGTFPKETKTAAKTLTHELKLPF